jgi:hypothetical protein
VIGLEHVFGNLVLLTQRFHSFEYAPVTGLTDFPVAIDLAILIA